jgi:hypothetical protein
MSGWPTGFGSGFFPSGSGGFGSGPGSAFGGWGAPAPAAAAPAPAAYSAFATSVNPAFLPPNITLRTSSEGKRAVIIGLDLTGSMGQVPVALVNGGLATLMKELKARQDIETPDVMFMGLGDVLDGRSSYNVAAQATNFQSDADASKTELQQMYLGGCAGGGNNTESYPLAWHFAAYKTNPVCMMQGEKGLLFTIGDELCPAGISGADLAYFMGAKEARDMSSQELLAQARGSYEVFHLKLGNPRTATTPYVQWEDILRDPQDPTKSFVIPVENWQMIPEIIISVIARYCGKRAVSDVVASWSNPATRAVVGAAIANLSTELVVRAKQAGDDETALTVVDYTTTQVATVDEIDADLAADAAAPAGLAAATTAALARLTMGRR